MSGDWIKMRASLLTSPKVNGIARFLECSDEATEAIVPGFIGSLDEMIPRNITRYVCVTALLQIWSAANEHTRNGVFENADLDDLDSMAGIPDFGAAMESVGWAVFDPDSMSVTLPNFNEYNVVGASRKSAAAERQRRYRERMKRKKTNGKCDETVDVTRDVTSDDREEKRREKKKVEKRKTTIPNDFPSRGDLEKAQAYWKKNNAPIDVQFQAQKFRAHHEARGTKFIDWPAGWRTWYINALTYWKKDQPKDQSFDFDALMGRA